MEEVNGYWAVNTKKGTSIIHESMGKLEAGVAVPIREKDIKMAKHLHGVEIIEKVVIPEDRNEWLTEPNMVRIVKEVK